MRRSILVIYLKYSFCFSLLSKMLFFHNCVMSTDGTSHEVEEKASLAFIWYYEAVSTWYFLIHKMDLWISIRFFVNLESMFLKNKTELDQLCLAYCFHVMHFTILHGQSTYSIWEQKTGFNKIPQIGHVNTNVFIFWNISNCQNQLQS